MNKKNNNEIILNTDENVVKLPVDVSENKISDISETINIARQMRIDTCEEITEMMMEWFTSTCGSYGIFSNSKRFNYKDLIMVENAISASLYRHYGITHPLHEITEKVFPDDGVDEQEK